MAKKEEHNVNNMASMMVVTAIVTATGGKAWTSAFVDWVRQAPGVLPR